MSLLDMHPIIANSHDLFIGTSGEDSSQFKLALALNNFLIDELNEKPNITVHFHDRYWKYVFYFPELRYGFEMIYSEQFINNAVIDKGLMRFIQESVKDQLNKGRSSK